MTEWQCDTVHFVFIFTHWLPNWNLFTFQLQQWFFFLPEAQTSPGIWINQSMASLSLMAMYGADLRQDSKHRGAEHPRWCHHSWIQSLPPLLAPQDQEVAIHAHWLHQKFKKWGGQGEAVVVKKVSASQCCLFLPVPLSFVYAKPPGARLCTSIASLSCGRKPWDMCIRIESLEELTGGKPAVFHQWDKGVNEPAPLFGQAYCKPWLETFFQGILYFLAVMLWGLTQQQSVAFPALCFTPIHFCR